MRAKRFFSILLCILMLGSIFPVSAFAEEDPCAGGHDYVSELTEPSCTMPGYTTYTCTRCGESYTEEGEDALGHDYVSELTVPPTQDSEGIMTWSCTRCGDSYTESVPRLSPDPEPQAETFSVFYELCGHGDEIAPVTVEAGSLLVRPDDPQADGYVFQGWYRDAGYEAAWDFDQDTVTEETTLFAYWVEESPVMLMGAPLRSGETVYAEGGAAEDAPSDGDPGMSGSGYTLTLNPNYPGALVEMYENVTSMELPSLTRSNYHFVGWSETSTGDDVAYSAGKSMSITLTSNKTLFAVWEPYTLTLNPNYSGALEEIYKNFTSMELPSLTRSGYLFLGWSETSTGSVAYRAGDPITLTSNKTLFAVWETLFPLPPVSNGGDVYLGGIRWRVIGADSGKWLLISADVLGETKTWGDANSYCGTVFNGFTSSEQNAVLSTTKTDDAAYDIYAASNFIDAKLFLLSASEAVTYFSTANDRKPGWWWLRSLHDDSDEFAGYVNGVGDLDRSNVLNDHFGARPAFQLNLASVLFESAAEGGKSDAGGGGRFGKFQASSTNVRKLTLIDSDRSGFSANVGGAVSATVVPGGALAVTYSGANTGENEYVSAMLTVGGQTYYASLTSEGSGTWNMTLPDDLAVGSSYTLKVFSEKQNGDKLTDYASSPVEITLTVSDTVPTTYAVTVNGGSGDGDYAEGASVTITANAPEAGMQFKEWTSEDGVTFTDAFSATTTFTMPAQAVTITATYEAAEAKPEFKSHTLVLSGQIGVNFYVDLSMLTEAERKAVTMDFTVNGKKTTDTFDASFTNPSTGEYFGFTCYINSVQMADEITAVLHYGDGDTVSRTYSAKQYVDHVLSHTDDYSANAVALVKAIADYGHYVQPFLADNNGWTVGPDHAAMDGVNTYSETDVGNARTAVAERAIVRDVGSSQIAAVSYSLNLESETAIRIYLKVQEGYTGEVTATMGGEPIACVKQRDGRYRIEVGGISAHKLGDVYDITVSAGGEFTISVSALSYVNTVLTSESSVFNNEAAHYAVTSLYNYYVATMAYKNNPNN